MLTITALFTVVVVVVGVFVVDALARWWRQNEWKRQWRHRDRDRDRDR